MARPCCSKPTIKIIKVAEIEAGNRGLEAILISAAVDGRDDEEQLKN